MAEKIHGIFTPHIVPLEPNGEINEPELRRYVDWLIDKGVHGLYPNGSTGEFTRFTPEERRRIIKIVCEQAAGRVPVLAGAAEANVRETLAACETYAGYGARAVAIVSPFYYKLCPESVYAYFREIALNSPIDVTLYNIPMFASPIDVPTIQRLAEFERIVGIKDSSGDMAFMMRMIVGRAADPARLHLPDRLGSRAGADAPDRLRRRHQRHQRRRARADAKALRSDPGRPDRRGHAAPVPPAGTVRRDALLGRFSRGLSRGGRAARLPGGPQPPAADRQAEDRPRRRCKRCCSASWPISATSTRPPAAARRAPATSTRTASARSRPRVLEDVARSGVPCERGPRTAGNDRPDADAGGGRRHGEGRPTSACSSAS